MAARELRRLKAPARVVSKSPRHSPSTGTRWLGGDIDIARPSPRAADTIESAGYTNDTAPGNGSNFDVINPKMKPFGDERVRQALSLAIDRKTLGATVFEGDCEPAGQFWGPRTPYFDEAAGPSEFDLAKARQLVQDAGADGATFEIATVDGLEQFTDMATYAQAQWQKIGLNAKIVPLPAAQVVGRFTQEKNIAVTIGGSGQSVAPAAEVSRYLASDALYNIAQLSSPEIDRLAAEAAKETDQAKRSQLLPFLAWRLAMLETDVRGIYAELRERDRPINSYLRGFWYDTAMSSGPAALASVLEIVGPERLVSGSDVPFAPSAFLDRCLEQLQFSDLLDEEQLLAVEATNAEELFDLRDTTGSSDRQETTTGRTAGRRVSLMSEEWTIISVDDHVIEPPEHVDIPRAPEDQGPGATRRRWG
jgi:hypothetical protein